MASVTTTASGKTAPWWRSLNKLSQEQVVAAIVIVLLIVYYAASDRITPLTTDAYVQAYVVQVAPQVGPGRLGDRVAAQAVFGDDQLRRIGRQHR